MHPDDKREAAITNTVQRQQQIQDEVAKADAAVPERNNNAMQAGARDYPVPPFEKTHQNKPGNEASLSPETMYDAPFYKGSGKLAGKVALITGGDSGIGRSVAILMAREGADIAISYLDEDRDARTTRDAVIKEGQKCLLLRGDVRETDFCNEAVETTVSELGGLDVLVNNAAFQVHTREIEDLSDLHFDETIRTNLHGYFQMARAAIPHMKNGSAIVNTGSTTGISGNWQLLDYSMSKGGIHAFTRALGSNLIDRGIRVNAVAPGPVWSPLNPSDRPAGEVETFGANTPMKRPAQPEELAPAYVFLASSHCSSYITGEILPVIGGY